MYLSRAEIVPVISSDAVSLVVGAPARVARPSAIGDDTCMLQVGVAFSVRARDPIPDSKPEPRWRFGKGERLSCHGQDLLGHEDSCCCSAQPRIGVGALHWYGRGSAGEGRDDAIETRAHDGLAGRGGPEAAVEV